MRPHPDDVDRVVSDIADELGVDPDDDEFMQCIREEIESGESVMVYGRAARRPTTEDEKP